MVLGAFKRSKDRGANLVEFAFVMPLLILLVIGIVEFAWVFATNLDVKHGAREGARITAVNQPPGGNANLAAEICSRMDLAGSDPTTITWQGFDLDGDGSIGVGDGVQVTVNTNELNTLTGILDWAFADVLELSSTVEIRIEQPPEFLDGDVTCP